MFSLSNSTFKTIKPLLAAKLDVSTPESSFNCFLVAQIDSLTLVWLYL